MGSIQVTVYVSSSLLSGVIKSVQEIEMMLLYSDLNRLIFELLELFRVPYKEWKTKLFSHKRH